MFDNEAKMQEWLESELDKVDGLNDLIENVDYPYEYKPKHPFAKQFQESYQRCIKSLDINTIISKNENISLDDKDILKPDILLYSDESQGLVIIELKNIANPTRQVGTELNAYGAELKTHLPFLADGDIYNVIISNNYPTLLKHYITRDVIWNHKNIICLIPIRKDGKVKLKIVDIDKISSSDIPNHLCNDHVFGYQLCLYDDELYGINPNRHRLDDHIEQMRTALSVMKTEGTLQGDNGFAFLWKDNWEHSLAPYSISMFHLSPFGFLERFLHTPNFDGTIASLPKAQQQFMRILLDESPDGYTASFDYITDKSLHFLKSFCNPCVECPNYWMALRDIMLARSQLIAFQGWGIFDELFNEALIKSYEDGKIEIPYDCPYLGLEVVENALDSSYEYIDPSFLSYEDDFFNDD
ncbi:MULTISPECIES: hypothetical protein [unclassified Moraxella]|uniref:hypothetical protein n=1 Tax=unclassified Moraxella TaxID=2685852 RepID=UPI003AF56BB3